MKNKPVQSTDLVVKRMDVFLADLSTGGVGSEQLGVRPVLVVQNNVGNRFSPTVIVCSITAKSKKNKIPTHIDLPSNEHGIARDSMILLEQLRTIDKKRLIRKVTHIDGPIVEEINKGLALSIGL